MTDKHLGPYIGFLGTCQRSVGPTWDDLCSNVAAWHVIWNDEAENSLACEAHAADAVERWGALQMHDRTLDCGMPGSLFVKHERRCIRDSDPNEQLQQILLAEVK